MVHRFIFPFICSTVKIPGSHLQILIQSVWSEAQESAHLHFLMLRDHCPKGKEVWKPCVFLVMQGSSLWTPTLALCCNMMISDVGEVFKLFAFMLWSYRTLRFWVLATLLVFYLLPHHQPTLPSNLQVISERTLLPCFHTHSKRPELCLDEV